MKKHISFFANISTILLLSLVSVSHKQAFSAEVPQKFVDALKKNEASINQCLKSVSNYYLEEASPVKENRENKVDSSFAKKETKKIIYAIRDCFDSTLQSIPGGVTAKFEFTGEFTGGFIIAHNAPVKGIFEVSLEDLVDNVPITKDKIKSFSVYEDWCTFENIEEFYFESSLARTALELRYVSSMVNSIVNAEENSQNLTSMYFLLDRLLTRIDPLSSTRITIVNGRLVLPSSSALNAIQDLEPPALNIKCVKEKNHVFSLESRNKKISITKPKQSQNSSEAGSWSWTWGEQHSTRKIGYLTIDIKEDNRRTSTTYTGVDFSISGSINQSKSIK